MTKHDAEDLTTTPGDPYLLALQTARQHLNRLLQQRRQMDGQIASLQATIAGLERVTGKAEDPQSSSLADVIRTVSESGLSAGITDSTRKVLARSGRPLQVHEIVTVLKECGFDIDRYVHPVAVVSSVVNRLVERGQARVADRTRGDRPRYEWVGLTHDGRE